MSDSRLLFIAVFAIIGGIYTVYKTWKDKAGKGGYLWGIGMIVFGVGFFALDHFFGIAVSAIFFIAVVGALMLIMGVRSIVITNRCTEVIGATYAGMEHNAKSTYLPVFEYDYEGVHYKARVAQPSAASTLESKYTFGEVYDVYIDPNNPKSCVLSKKLHFSEVFLILMGVAFTGFVVFAVLNPDVISFS